MKNLKEIKKILNKNKEKIKNEYGVKFIGIFGSFARGGETRVSDVDIVEFEKPIGLKFIELANYLEEILNVNIDLFTVNSVKQKPMLRKNIKDDLIYV